MLQNEACQRIADEAFGMFVEKLIEHFDRALMRFPIKKVQRAEGENAVALSGSTVPEKRVGRMRLLFSVPVGAHEQGSMQTIPQMIRIRCVGCKTAIGRLTFISLGRGSRRGVTIAIRDRFS